jgi:hypothetical protein
MKFLKVVQLAAVAAVAVAVVRALPDIKRYLHIRDM